MTDVAPSKILSRANDPASYRFAIRDFDPMPIKPPPPRRRNATGACCADAGSMRLPHRYGAAIYTGCCLASVVPPCITGSGLLRVAGDALVERALGRKQVVELRLRQADQQNALHPRIPLGVDEELAAQSLAFVRAGED